MLSAVVRPESGQVTLWPKPHWEASRCQPSLDTSSQRYHQPQTPPPPVVSPPGAASLSLCLSISLCLLKASAIDGLAPLPRRR